MIDNKEKHELQVKEWKKKNPEKDNAHKRKWDKNNLHKIKEYQKKYQKIYTKTRGREKYVLRQKAYHYLKNKLIQERKICRVCGGKEKLEIHHKDYESNDLDNLMLLCGSCHRQLHNELKNLEKKNA